MDLKAIKEEKPDVKEEKPKELNKKIVEKYEKVLKKILEGGDMLWQN